MRSGHVFLFLLCVLAAQKLPGQAIRGNGSIRGTVVDPSGALVTNADVTLESQGSASLSSQLTHSSNLGRFSFSDVPAGQYIVRAVSKGFAAFESKPLALLSGQTHTIAIQLAIATAEVHMDISGETAGDTDPNQNGDAVVLRGRAVDELPTDPTVLQQEIQALSGGDSPSIYVDGFSGGTLPPRQSIREIRINQNPYSARNDTEPVNGTIEIFTKPGSDKLHSSFFVLGNHSGLNAQSPFAKSQPPYYYTQYEVSLSDSLNRKTSYIVNYFRRVSATNAVINAEILDSNLNQASYSQALPSPATNTSFSPRLDFQWGERSTVDVRYSWSANRQTDAGIGQLNLSDQGYDSTVISQAFQASNSQILSAKVVNDTRVQYVRTRTTQTPQSTAPTLMVQGSFTSGGSSAGALQDKQDRYELQNYLAIQAGKHHLSPGVRLRVVRDANVSHSNYNGQYVFATLDAYQTAARALASCAPTAPATQCTVPGATQFSISRGTPSALVDVADVAAFYQDDWKARPNFTLSYGLRYEAQNNISEKHDFAPRLAFAWALGATDKKPPRYVLRIASGIFYTRLAAATLLQQARQNGVTQQNYIVANPAFYPSLPDPSTLGAQSLPTVFHISPGFRSPYTWNNTVSLDHPLGTRGSVSFNYIYNRSVHLGLTRNINSPLPGTYDSANPSSGLRPYGKLQNIYQYESTGVARTNRIFGSFNLRGKHDLYLYSQYMLRFRKQDTNQDNFPSNEYNIGADYGRGWSDIRHTFLFDLNYPIPITRINISAYLVVNSGRPFNIVVGQDLNGDSQFNDRPAFATDLARPSVVRTSYGIFDTSPIAGQTVIPINYGNGPAIIENNLQIYRTFTFGAPLPQPPAGSLASSQANRYTQRKYSLLIGVEAQNALNHPNLTTPIGVLGSPLFGKSTGLTGTTSANADRMINLLIQASF